MNRCVRVVGRDGNSILASSSRVVKIGNCDTFRDVFRTLALQDVDKLRVTNVQLAHTANTPAKDATETHDLDELISDIIQLVASSQGYDPMSITFVVSQPSQIAAPAPADARDRPTSTQTVEAAIIPDQQAARGSSIHLQKDRVAAGGAGAGDKAFDEQATGPPSTQHPPNCENAGASATDDASDLQKIYVTMDEVARWVGYSPRQQVQAVVTRDYLCKNNCGFRAHDPRRKVFEAVEDIFVYLTPRFLRGLQLQCSVAESELQALAEARTPHDIQQDWPACEEERRLSREAIARATQRLQCDEAIQRVVSREEWLPVRRLISALQAAVAGSTGSADSDGASGAATVPGEQPPAAVTPPPLPPLRTPAGPERSCPPKAGHKRSAPACDPPATPAPKAARVDLGAAQLTPPGTPATVSTAQHSGSPQKSQRKSSGVASPRYTVVDSFYVAGRVRDYKGQRFRPLQRVLSDYSPMPLKTWQPGPEYVVMMDKDWFCDRPVENEQELQATFRRAMLYLKDKTASCMQTVFTFPYGVVSLRANTSNALNGKKEWFAWRLPDAHGADLTDAHDRMVGFFEADLKRLRKISAHARAARRLTADGVCDERYEYAARCG